MSTQAQLSLNIGNSNNNPEPKEADGEDSNVVVRGEEFNSEALARIKSVLIKMNVQSKKGL